MGVGVGVGVYLCRFGTFPGMCYHFPAEMEHENSSEFIINLNYHAEVPE